MALGQHKLWSGAFLMPFCKKKYPKFTSKNALKYPLDMVCIKGMKKNFVHCISPLAVTSKMHYAGSGSGMHVCSAFVCPSVFGRENLFCFQRR